MWLLLSFLLAFPCFISAASVQRRTNYALKNAHPVPSKWVQIGRAPQSHTIGLRIGLRQSSFENLEQRLHQVSDPGHDDFGKWLSDDEVLDHVVPHETTLSAVQQWLLEHGISTSQSSGMKDWIYVPVTVEQAERMLDTEYYTYKHTDNGDELVRTPQYSLPAALHQHIDVVAPTTYFGNLQAMRSSFILRPVNTDPNCHQGSSSNGSWPAPYPQTNISKVCDQDSVTNECLRTLYNTVNYKPQVPQRNYVAIASYLNETANISDFHVFLSRQRQDASLNYTFNVTTINNGINFQQPEPQQYYRVRDLEANIDSQTIGGFVYPTRFEAYSTGGSPPFQEDYGVPTNTNEPYLDWLNYILAQDRSTLPNVISTSYSDDEQTVPIDYATRVCQDFAQLTSKGITLLFSSGDDGVGQNGTCYSNDGNDTEQFLPNFPASCPYVTVLGATRSFQPEIVAYDTLNGFVSGSGVSNYFARPAWQNAAFSSYASKIGNLHQGLYNTTGRAYPDISAQGYHYRIVYAGQDVLLDGTSCATPTMAGVLTLVNDALIAAGRPTLGFINPWLYRFGNRAFTDIVHGNVWGCDSSGFPATAGWDLASGWGTPDFLKLKGIALQGPPVNAPWW